MAAFAAASPGRDGDGVVCGAMGGAGGCTGGGVCMLWLDGGGCRAEGCQRCGVLAVSVALVEAEQRGRGQAGVQTVDDLGTHEW